MNKKQLKEKVLKAIDTVTIRELKSFSEKEVEVITAQFKENMLLAIDLTEESIVGSLELRKRYIPKDFRAEEASDLDLFKWLMNKRIDHGFNEAKQEIKQSLSDWSENEKKH